LDEGVGDLGIDVPGTAQGPSGSHSVFERDEGADGRWQPGEQDVQL
jgi:hypothetical protein